MSDGFSLINIDGKLAEPATVLIQKIADAIGGGFKPRQIRRIAEAQADADIIKAKAQIEIDEIQKRALIRFVAEESKKQDNIESITEQSFKYLDTSSNPQDIDDDWITNFFDKCRIISDTDMQLLWAKILAGEANSPGTYSKRTINVLGSFSKTDAELFSKLCNFNCQFEDEIIPFVFYDEDFVSGHSIYIDNGINFVNLLHLSSINLINFEPVGFKNNKLPNQIILRYHEDKLTLNFKQPVDNQMSTGNILLTSIGMELARICDSKEIDGFVNYLITKFSKQGITVS